MTTLRFHRLRVRRFTRTLKNWTTVSKIETMFLKKYIVHKIGSAPVENDLERKTKIAPNSSHLCLKNRVSDFFVSGLVYFLHSVKL